MKKKKTSYDKKLLLKYIFLALGFITLFLINNKSDAQTFINKQDTTYQLKFLTPATLPHKKRLIGISSFGLVSYGTVMGLVGTMWYPKYEQTNFHFYNDNGEWLQIDKVGHAWTAYSEMVYATKLYQWCGLTQKKSAVIGSSMAFVFQMGIEVFDGFSAKWGASPGDILANTAGAALGLSQSLFWNEQRVILKFSSHQPDYSAFSNTVQTRAIALYGDNFAQQLLKDYNGQSYWLSVNIASFMPKHTWVPPWLNLAVGYSAENLLGGFTNEWQDTNGINHDYTHLQRYRQWYCSVDVDLNRIKTKSKLLKVLFAGFNTLKIPAPTIEWNTQGTIKVHPLYW